MPLAAWERAGLVLLAVGAAVGFALYPTWPNYDSAYSLVWGREVVDGALPSFDAFRAPTEHPLAVAVGTVLAPLGTELAPRVWLALTVVAFVVLVAGVHRLARVAFGPAVAFVAALLLLSRLDYGFLAARGYIDVPYLALVVWAAVLVTGAGGRAAQRPVPVLVLLAFAGLLRPEAWLLAGAYWLWLATDPAADWPGRVRLAVLTAVAPLLWVATDWIVTGDPLFSQHHTNDLAAELGRQKRASEAPELLVHYLEKLTKWPVLAASVIGIVLAWRMARERAAVPLVLTASGVLTFGAIAVAGLAVIDRYLAISALGLLLFAAFAVAGWTRLPRGHRWRAPWAAAAAVAVLGGGGWTVTHLSLDRVTWELEQRADVRRQLEGILQDPAVQRARACGPVTVPTHKLLPDTRWILDAAERDVLARNQLRDFGRHTKGVHVHLHGEAMLRNTAYGPFDSWKQEPPLILVPGPDARVIARTEGFTAYASC
ncbi:hypothetical protein [Conexibacter sp. SYSU D00693]|uniref:hypothetical protein n=1 Tax=Conexibacter sp. SYSU D00693 TaxID=2812560 RepID=UPI00196B5FF9|nr:hypothetical protein [Conexibacter sp. SYSU D00693]